MGERAILSSSPESFLHITQEGTVSTRPIKGTARRSGDATADATIYHELANSTKNRAENLMIVDLMRHDLSHHCESGSIAVEDLFKITEHPHLYHMVSTVTGQKKPEASTLDLIQACFPPGSMTGAPKIAAIRWCQKMEQMQRGIYSGALGWIHSDGSADLSVVIRTLLLDGNRFEFQVGGGIVADSTPESEWEETLTKATGIASTLGISLDALREI
jgi:anthranilate/para-aminobenzoate synthase component I